MPLFNQLSLDETFELLINRKIIAGEFNKASKKINKLKNNDWRLWFGRFLLCIRSDAENYRFTDAYICLKEAENLLNNEKSLAEYEKFHSFITKESLFLIFKFYYDSTGITSIALFLARAYQNGWGVKQDIEKAYEFAQKAAKTKDYDPLYPDAIELLNTLSLQIPDLKEH